MSTDLYNQIYRCRKCGKEFCPVTTHERSAAGKDISERMTLVPKLYAQHNCDNGDIGVADFIGYEKQEL